jgi:hypothetical protein
MLLKSLEGIELGIEIYHMSHIEKALKLPFDFIVVEPERRHLSELEFCQKYEQKDFYKRLFETFPDKPILIQLPRPETIQMHFMINENPSFNMMNFSRFSHFYMEELNAISKHNHNHLSIIIPDLVNRDDYRQIKQHIISFFNRKNYPEIGIGLGIDTTETFYNHKAYPKFNYAIIELEKIFYEKYDNAKEDGIKYLKDLLQLKYELKRRNKPLYIRGETLHRFNGFQGLLKNGFKHFVIDETKFNLYLEMIKAYKSEQEQRQISP